MQEIRWKGIFYDVVSVLHWIYYIQDAHATGKYRVEFS